MAAEEEIDSLLKQYYGAGLQGQYCRDSNLMAWIDRIYSLDSTLYSLPNRTETARVVIRNMTHIIHEMTHQTAEAGKLCLFLGTILFRCPNVTKNKDICDLINTRIDMWHRGMFEELVQMAESYN